MRPKKSKKNNGTMCSSLHYRVLYYYRERNDVLKLQFICLFQNKWSGIKEMNNGTPISAVCPMFRNLPQKMKWPLPLMEFFQYRAKKKKKNV